MVTAVIEGAEKSQSTTVHIKLTNKRNKNRGDHTRLTWYVKRNKLQEAISAIVGEEISLDGDDDYIELQGKEPKLHFGTSSIALKKQVKEDMYFIKLEVK